MTNLKNKKIGMTHDGALNDLGGGASFTLGVTSLMSVVMEKCLW